MGKITSIYLTNEEAEELERFCEENGCTQYSVVKSALRELLSKHIREHEHEVSPKEDIQPDQPSEPEQPAPTNVQKKKIKMLKKLYEKLNSINV